jgi:phosphinothricin acetyltransferase
MKDLLIRAAALLDSAQIVDIYAPYVRESAVTFDEEVPTIAAMSHKIEDIQKMYPFLVAQYETKVIGYAYASAFRPRAAFRWSVEVTVYVSREHHRRGVARALYDVLLPTLKNRGFVTAYAAITLPGWPSVALHEAYGFRGIATFAATGFKLGAWHDVGFWELRLNSPSGNPPEPLSVLTK